MNKEAEFQAQFARLRGDYDVAFRKLCRAMSELQNLGANAAEETRRTAKKRVEECRRETNYARNQLGVFLLARKVERSSFRMKNRAA